MEKKSELCPYSQMNEIISWNFVYTLALTRSSQRIGEMHFRWEMLYREMLFCYQYITNWKQETGPQFLNRLVCFDKFFLHILVMTISRTRAKDHFSLPLWAKPRSKFFSVFKKWNRPCHYWTTRREVADCRNIKSSVWSVSETGP